VRIATYYLLFSAGTLIAIVFGLFFSRIFQALTLSFFPYARGKEGKAFGYRVSPPMKIILICQLFIGGIAIHFFQQSFSVQWALVLGSIAATFVIRACMRRIGGITGDCIGAQTELFELTFFTAIIIWPG